MVNAFQSGAFQAGAFQSEGTGAVTSTRTLQLPVDCVMAGDQEKFPERRRRGNAAVRPGRLSRAMMRHTFNE